MAKTFNHAVTNFSGGLLEDKRASSNTHFGLTKHFDAYTYPKKLVPYAQTVVANGLLGASVKPLKIVKFAYAPAVSGYHLVGFGVDQSDNTNPCLFSLDINGAANGTAANALNFVTVSNSIGGSFGRNTNVFFYYKSWVYFFDGVGLRLQKEDPTGVSVGNNNVATVPSSNVAQPVHHPLDDIAYFFANNVVYSLNNTTWNGAVLTLPAEEIITCGAAHGNYLAIATVTNGGGIGARSKVYLWDRDSSLTTVTDIVDFGEGLLRYIGSLNGKLIGVVDYYTQYFWGLGKSKFIVKQASGEFGIPLNEIISDTAGSQDTNDLIIKDNKMYFPATLKLDGDTRHGIWCVDSNGKMNLDYQEPNATSYDGIFNVGGVWFIAHSADGSVTHTDGTNTYSASNPSVYETLYLSHVSDSVQDPTTTKKLMGVSATFQALTSGQSVKMYYRKDSDLYNESAWTLIFTESTVGANDHHAIKDNAGNNFPNYNEIQFKIESYGGAVLTGWEYKAEIVPNSPF